MWFIGGLIFALFVIYCLAKINTLNQKLYTITEYKTNNPKCIKKDRVTCNTCGSNHIQIRFHEKTFIKRINKHICVQCGKILYYSEER